MSPQVAGSITITFASTDELHRAVRLLKDCRITVNQGGAGVSGRFTPEPGDAVMLRRTDNGTTFPALCTRVTKGRRVECSWECQDRRRRGTRTRPALLDPDRILIVGRAPDDEAEKLRGMPDWSKPE